MSSARSTSRATPAASSTAYPPEPEDFVDAAETFALLATPTRVHLLWLLAAGDADVGTLAAAVGASVPTVSQHLAKLRLADLVSSRAEGRRQVYSLEDPHIVTLLSQAVEHHAALRHGVR